MMLKVNDLVDSIEGLVCGMKWAWDSILRTLVLFIVNIKWR